MSHFFTLVLVPDDTVDVRSEVEDLLAPYDEELAVPEYQTMCFCVRDRSYRQANEEAAARFGTLEQLQTRFNAEYCRPDCLNEYDSHWRKQQAWTEFAKDFFEFC